MTNLNWLLFMTPLSLVASSTMQNPSKEMTPSESRPTESRPTELQRLSLDELILRLPNVRDEFDWDHVNDPVLVPPVAELKARIDKGVKLTDDQWKRALLHAGVIRIRNVWPKSEPFAISMRSPNWLGVAKIQMVSSSPRLKSAEVGELLAEFCGAASQSKREAELYQQLGNLDTGESRLIFDVKVERGKERAIPGEPPPPPPGEIWRGSMPFSIRIVDTLAESIPPRSGETVDAGVRDSIGIEICDLTFDERMQRTARLVLKPDPAQFPSVASTALSLTVEVLKEGQVVESTRLVATCRELPSVSKHGIPVTRREIGSLVLRSIPASVETDDSVRAKYRLRITGTDKDVIREWDAARWWSGSLTMPLTEVCERESRRAGPSAR